MDVMRLLWDELGSGIMRVEESEEVFGLSYMTVLIVLQNVMQR